MYCSFSLLHTWQNTVAKITSPLRRRPFSLDTELDQSLQSRQIQYFYMRTQAWYKHNLSLSLVMFLLAVVHRWWIALIQESSEACYLRWNLWKYQASFLGYFQLLIILCWIICHLYFRATINLLTSLLFKCQSWNADNLFINLDLPFFNDQSFCLQ